MRRPAARPFSGCPNTCAAWWIPPKIYRMDLGYTREQLAEAMQELVRVNEMDSCYIRPIAIRAYGDIGVNPLHNPVDVYLACWEWGKYLGEEALSSGRGCVRLQLEAHRAQYPARLGEGRRQLHELAAHQNGSDHQWIFRRHRAR